VHDAGDLLVPGRLERRELYRVRPLLELPGANLIKSSSSLMLQQSKGVLYQTGQVFNSKCGHGHLYLAITLIIKTVKLKVENSAQTTFRLSPATFRAPPLKCFLSIDKLVGPTLTKNCYTFKHCHGQTLLQFFSEHQ
jgi:hypothetical protein